MRSRRIAVMAAGAALLSACVANAVRSDYHGPLAHITDSVTPRDDKSADFFYLARVDGYPIAETLAATEGASRGSGGKPVLIGRDVAATETTFSVVGVTHYTAPLLALNHPAYELSGDVSFTPVAHHDYVVRGVLGETYSAVWVEDKATGDVAGQKIEVMGAAPLSLLGKLGLQ